MLGGIKKRIKEENTGMCAGTNLREKRERKQNHGYGRFMSILFKIFLSFFILF